MARYTTRGRNQISPYPRPHDLEERADYVARFMADQHVQRACRTAVKAHVAAEREWTRAKEQSMVSVTTSAGQFLLFGDPTSRRDDWR